MISVGPSSSLGASGEEEVDGGADGAVEALLGGDGERPGGVEARVLGVEGASELGVDGGLLAATGVCAGVGTVAGTAAAGAPLAAAGAAACALTAAGALVATWALADAAAAFAAGAGAAIGRSAWWLIENPQFGQKLSSLEWIAAQRGHAVMPASRRTVTGRRSPSTPSSVRSCVSIWLRAVSLASTSASLRCPKRCKLKTSPPRSR